MIMPAYRVQFPIILSNPHRCLSKLNVTKTCLFYVFREQRNLEKMEYKINYRDGPGITGGVDIFI